MGAEPSRTAPPVKATGKSEFLHHDAASRRPAGGGYLRFFLTCKQPDQLSFFQKRQWIGGICLNRSEPRSNACPSNEWTSIRREPMLEILITTFVAAFVAVTLFGHIMVAQALMTPDRA